MEKEKIQDLIDKQRTNLADVDYLDLDSVSKIVKDFNNPKLPEGYDAASSRSKIHNCKQITTKEDVSKYTNYASVSVLKDGMEVVHSSHRLRDKQVLNKIEKEQMLWNRLESTDSTSSAQGGSTDQNIALTRDEDTNSSDKSKNKFRVTPEQDKAYIDAIEKGDMENCSRNFPLPENV